MCLNALACNTRDNHPEESTHQKYHILFCHLPGYGEKGYDFRRIGTTYDNFELIPRVCTRRHCNTMYSLASAMRKPQLLHISLSVFNLLAR